MRYSERKRFSLWKSLRNCPLCGATWPPKDWICPPCQGQLHRLFLEPGAMRWMEERNMEVHSLLDWKRGEDSDRFLSRLLYSLKAGKLKAAWEALALEFLSGWIGQWSERDRLKGGPIGDEIVLIPAPPAQRGATDHALEFARALGHLLQAPVWQGLRRTPKSSSGWVQKRLGRAQRGRLQLEREGGAVLSQLEGRSLIFVDDLITTGATARAARAALSDFRGQSFLCWTLLRRSLPEEPSPEWHSP